MILAPYIYGSRENSFSLDIPTIVLKISGVYRLQAVDKVGRVLRSRTVKNTVTSAGLQMLTQSDILSPWLDAAIVTMSNNQRYSTNSLIDTSTLNSSSSPFKTTTTSIFEFPAGVLNGVVVQVGAGRQGSGHAGSTTFSSVPVRDMFEDITSMPINSDEKLRVVYSVSLTIPENSFNFNLNSNGLNTLCTLRAQNVTSTSFSQVAPAKNTGWNLNGSNIYSGRYPVRLATGAINATGCSRPVAYDDDILSPISGIPRDVGTFVNGAASIVETINDSPSSVLCRMYWQPSHGNTSNGIGRICFRTGRDGAEGFPTTNWNMIFSPRIPKNDYYGLNLRVRLEFIGE